MRILISGSPQTTITKIGAVAYQRYFGQLTCYRSGNTIIAEWWAMDNRAFVGFESEPFTRYLERRCDIPGCLFVVAPDVVGNAQATLQQFTYWQSVIRAYGYPVALAAQDGLESLPIPWSDFDALFIGGSTAWKLSISAARIVGEAKQRGKWVHMGRVNSIRRLRYAQAIGCDSVDGSGYNIEPAKVIQHLPILQTYQQSFWEIT